MKDKLRNDYVKEYYDRQVEQLENYTNNRWKTSPVQSFEYRQTGRALESALSGHVFENAIEVGPGDGAWTKNIHAHITNKLHLIEQSEAMLEQAKARLESLTNITFDRADVMSAPIPFSADLIVAIRCFEYFDNKRGVLQKLFDSLVPNGKLILITKNAQMYSWTPRVLKILHSDQCTKQQMEDLLKDTGFVLDGVYPAVLRLAARYAPMRFLFDILHRISVVTKGKIHIPLLTTRATESFIFIARRPK